MTSKDFNNELYHYGVLGMKWGVRKARLTIKSNDKIGDNYTDRQKKKIRRQATEILNGEISSNNYANKVYSRSADKAFKRADKLVWKSEDRQNKGDQKGFEKYQGKAWKQLYKQHIYLELAKTAATKSNIAKKRLSDINDGVLEAGRDYVTNYITSTNIPMSLVGVLNWSTEKRIDFREP